MSDDVNGLKKKLKAKGKGATAPDWSTGLSTGSTLLNLALSGRTGAGFLGGNYYYFVGDSGSGKAQPLDAKVLTPKGWVRMGDLRVGDYVVDPDGGVGSVEKIFPQGTKEVFRVELTDGTSTECTDDHLWLTSTLVERQRERRAGQDVGSMGSVKPLRKIRETMSDWGRDTNHHLPTVFPVEFDTRTADDLRIRPYLLGALLGNGHLGKNCVYFSTCSRWLRDKVEDLLPNDCRLKKISKGNYAILGRGKGKIHPLFYRLRELGLAGKKAETKFVPELYLRSTITNRIKLLQGLMDTDGYAPKHGSPKFNSSSPELAGAVMELVQSLGGVASMGVKPEPKYTYKGERRTGKPNYGVTIRYLPEEFRLFTLPRKAERYQPRQGDAFRAIRSVESVGEKECQCVRVSTKRNLYVTDNYIVTHNTFFTMTCFAEAVKNPHFKGHRLIFDNAERGALMDWAKFFGRTAADKIEPPSGTKDKPKPSAYLEQFYYNVQRALDGDKPFIYVVDSIDALRPKSVIAEFDKKAAAPEQTKKPGLQDKDPGTYGTERARINSNNMPIIFGRLMRTESILICISQTRENIGFGAQFNPKTRGGGKALTFYAACELWTSVRDKVRVKVRGHNLTRFTRIRVDCKKNRLSGKDRSVIVPFSPDVGFDDTGSLVDYLVEWEHWEAKGKDTDQNKTIVAPEFDFEGKREALVQKIESEDGEKELRLLVAGVWREVEEKIAVTRKARYV